MRQQQRMASASTCEAGPRGRHQVRAERAQRDLCDSGWTLMGHIGRGGFGDVFEAQRAGEAAAVKIMTRGDDLTERWAYRTVGYHPNVVRFIEAGDGWVALEYVEGHPMADVDMTERDAITSTLDVARATAHCHSRGVVHLDIKPANVILTPAQAILLDFGLAAPMGTEIDSQTGTPGYVAPEVLNVEGCVDERADVYGLGCLLHWALTGHGLFEDASPIGTLRRQLRGQALNRVEGDLGDVIETATEVERRDRFETVADFIAALEGAS